VTTIYLFFACCLLMVVGVTVTLKAGSKLQEPDPTPTPAPIEPEDDWAEVLHDLNASHEQAKAEQTHDWATRGVLVVAEPCLPCLLEGWRVAALPGTAECVSCREGAWRRLCHVSPGLLGKERRWRRDGIPAASRG